MIKYAYEVYICEAYSVLFILRRRVSTRLSSTDTMRRAGI